MQASTSGQQGQGIIAGVKESLQRAVVWEDNGYKLLIAGGVVAVVGGLGFLYYKKTHYDDESNTSSAPKEPIAAAEARKKQGIEAYSLKDYEVALEKFKLAVEALKLTEPIEEEDEQKKKAVKNLLSNCHNNIAACYENMGLLDECVKSCSNALEFNPKYWKAINRRARALVQLKSYREALSDYIEAADIKDLTEAQLTSTYEERERISQLIVKPQIDVMMEEIKDISKPIPQYVIGNWIWYSVTKDPLVLKADKLDPRTEYLGLDSALNQIKKGAYDQVLPMALKTADDEGISTMDRALVVLLISRFLLLHNRLTDARLKIKEFEAVWDILDEQSKIELKDIKVAYFCILVNLAESNTQAETYVKAALIADPDNADSLMTLGLRFMEQECEIQAISVFEKASLVEPHHPYIKYYIIYLNFVDACKNQRINEAHNCIYQFDQALKDTTDPPVFALLLFVKICVLFSNSEMAVKSCEKAIAMQPNNAYALSLHALIVTEPNEKLELCLDRLERNMEKVIEADPNYWEPYRTLARMALERAKTVEEEKVKVLPLYEKAIKLARRREEFDILLKDRLWAEIEMEHRENRKLAVKQQFGSKSS